MSELKELCRQRVLAKKAEDEAVAARKAIDADIAKLMRTPGLTEGTASEKLEGFKVSVSYGITRKLDTKKLQSDWDKITAPVRACINWKADLSTTAFRALDQDNLLALSNYMESKESSPTVKVELLA